MEGIDNYFACMCNMYGIAIEINDTDHYCSFRERKISVPVQDTDHNLFIGFHELAHWVLHRNDTRNYKDLQTRIRIEREADKWANEQMEKLGKPIQNNPVTDYHFRSLMTQKIIAKLS